LLKVSNLPAGFSCFCCSFDITPSNLHSYIQTILPFILYKGLSPDTATALFLKITSHLFETNPPVSSYGKALMVFELYKVWLFFLWPLYKAVAHGQTVILFVLFPKVYPYFIIRAYLYSFFVRFLKGGLVTVDVLFGQR